MSFRVQKSAIQIVSSASHVGNILKVYRTLTGLLYIF